ncbi:hypothetical protein CS8_076490 [Cupriavidus sp. 8B]
MEWVAIMRCQMASEACAAADRVAWVTVSPPGWAEGAGIARSGTLRWSARPGWGTGCGGLHITMQPVA